MKTILITSVIALLSTFWSLAGAQNNPEEYLGLPGDNLNLFAVMKLFQESETLESFERQLNDENTRINNLDLNGDNLVDYLMVMDYQEGDFHTIVLRAAIGKNETQDVAVFTVKRFTDESVQIQLVGDEALYGKNYIIEPIYAEAEETPNPGYIGTPVADSRVKVVRTTTYEIASWPLITFIYRPNYIVWRSSWRWGFYPEYYSHWRPYYWHTYYGYHSHWHNHYYAHYRPWNHHRHVHYNTVYYTKVRTHSPTVVVNINKGVYRTTYSRPDLRSEGDRLYANTRVNRSSATTAPARVRNTGTTSVNRGAVQNNTSSARRASTVANERTTPARSTETRANSVQSRSSGTQRQLKTSTTVNRNTNTQRKSATLSSGEVRRQSADMTRQTTVRSPQSSGSKVQAPESAAFRTKKATSVTRSTAPAVRSVQKAPARQPNKVTVPAQSRSSSNKVSPTPHTKTRAAISQPKSQPRKTVTSSRGTQPAKRSTATIPSGRQGKSSSTNISGRR